MLIRDEEKTKDLDTLRQNLVKAVENLVEDRRKNKSKSKSKVIRAEIISVIPSWKNYTSSDESKRIKRPPARWEIMNLAELFQCNTHERNTLLVAAGYKPEEQFIEDKVRLRRLIEPYYRVMEKTQYPCYIVNKDWRLLAMSSTALKFFGLTKTYLLNFPPEYLNIISLLTMKESPIRDMIKAQGDEYWWRVIYRNIMGFKAENELCLYDQWYIKIIEKFRESKEFIRIYDEGYVPKLEPGENTEDWMEYLTRFNREGVVLTTRSVIAKVGDLAHPQLIYYVPADKATEIWFADNLGISLPTPPEITELL